MALVTEEFTQHQRDQMLQEFTEIPANVVSNVIDQVECILNLWNRFGIPAQFKNDAHLDVWDPNHRMLRDGCAGIPNLSRIFNFNNVMRSSKISLNSKKTKKHRFLFHCKPQFPSFILLKTLSKLNLQFQRYSHLSDAQNNEIQRKLNIGYN